MLMKFDRYMYIHVYVNVSIYINKQFYMQKKNNVKNISYNLYACTIVIILVFYMLFSLCILWLAPLFLKILKHELKYISFYYYVVA